MKLLTKYLIQTADGPAYRSGNLDGMRHPAVDGGGDPGGRGNEKSDK